MKYLTTKHEEIVPFVTTPRDLEDILVSEISQTEKHKYCVISLAYRIQTKQNKTPKSLKKRLDFWE